MHQHIYHAIRNFFIGGLSHLSMVRYVPTRSDCSPRLLLNMLIGVMCEVVSGVSQTERQAIAEAFVREKATSGRRGVWLNDG